MNKSLTGLFFGVFISFLLQSQTNTNQYEHNGSCNHTTSLTVADFDGEFNLKSHKVEEIRATLSKYLKRDIIEERLGLPIRWNNNSTDVRDVVSFVAENRAEFLTALAQGMHSGEITNRQMAEELFDTFIVGLKGHILAGDYPKTEPTDQNKNREWDGPCVNMDFEEGSTNGWELYRGRNYGDAVYSFTNQSVAAPGAFHQIMNAGQMDPVIAGLPAVNPNGGSHSIRIGDGPISSGGGFLNTYGHAAMIRQSFLVTPDNAVFTFSYAVVLESPVNHSSTQYPYFVLRVFDEDGNEAECGSYEVTSSSGGSSDFIVGGQNGAGEDIFYIPWTTAFSPLDDYIGQNVTVEFYTADCSQTGHYGYAYVDASCNSLEIDASNDFNIICGQDPVTLYGPPNASSYEWSTGETDPSITVNGAGTYEVVVVPVQGSQCELTLTVELDGAPNPIAELSANPVEVCAFSEIDFVTTGSSAPSGYTLENYVWDFGNGVVSPAGNGVINDGDLTNTSGSFDAPSHLFENTGDYTVTVTVITEAGCQDQATIAVQVVEAPDINAGEDQTLCDGETFTPQAEGGMNYSWNEGLVDGEPTVLSVGTYTFTVTGYNSTGCPNTDQVTIIVDTAPSVDAGEDVSICIGEEVTLAASGAADYVWSDGITDGVPFTPTETTTYTVTVSSPNGCDGTDDVTITVNDLPSIGANNPSACEGSVVTLNGTGGVSYSWNNGVVDGQPFVPVSGTTYTVTGTDANGCVNTFDVTVITSAYPTADFIATPTSGQPPLEVTIVNQSQGDITDFAWNFGNGNFSDEDFDVNTQFYNSAGNPTIVLIASNNECNDTLTLMLTIQYGAFSYEIPNVFTPNNDGANDFFDLKLENAAELELYIFNRWGNLMAEIRDVNTPGWNGKTQSGADAPEGVYFHRYRIVGLDGQEVEGHGFLNLVRE